MQENKKVRDVVEELRGDELNVVAVRKGTFIPSPPLSKREAVEEWGDSEVINVKQYSNKGNAFVFVTASDDEVLEKMFGDLYRVDVRWNKNVAKNSIVSSEDGLALELGMKISSLLGEMLRNSGYLCLSDADDKCLSILFEKEANARYMGEMLLSDNSLLRGYTNTRKGIRVSHCVAPKAFIENLKRFGEWQRETFDERHNVFREIRISGGSNE